MSNRSLTRCVTTLAIAAVSAGALAQTVTVDLSRPVNILTATSVGYLANSYDGINFDAAGAPYLRAAGVSAPRFPGNHGVADLYHWTTNTLTPYKGYDKAPYFAPEANIAGFAQLAEKLGNAVIVVNYGSNAEGTGPADPAEAAALVAYANGNPADTHAIPSTPAHDWHTVGYWAALRASPPLGIEDGMNFLRLNHAKPFGIRLWQVGDQIFNNGYFGGDHTGNPDLHGPAPAGSKDFAKLRKLPQLSAAAYAANYKTFAAAMKAVDPSIMVGVGFTTPPDGDKFAPDWNRNVLKGACADIDFVALDWTTGNPAAPDYKSLDESSLFSTSRSDIATIVKTMLDDDKQSCPAGHTPRIAFSTASPLTWPKYDHPVVRALWVADVYSLLIESGFANIDWPEAYGDTMMSADRKKFGPAYYGLQMLHIVAHAPGDAFVDARVSGNSSVSAHATRRRDNIIGLLLVNTDPKAAATVKVSLKGASVATSGKRFDYGAAQFAQGTGPAASAFSASGSEFTITIPPYSVTDVLLPMAQ